jgi:hypothetical protein
MKSPTQRPFFPSPLPATCISMRWILGRWLTLSKNSNIAQITRTFRELKSLRQAAPPFESRVPHSLAKTEIPVWRLWLDRWLVLRRNAT